MSGSFVAAGAGRYRATAVGSNAYATRIAQDARRFTLTGSELRSGIDRILRYVTWAIVPTATLLFVSQLRTHDGWRAAMSGRGRRHRRDGAGGARAAHVGGARSRWCGSPARRVLVQELAAVEGLARVDVLCIDKTGTLTEGRLVAGDRRAARRRGRSVADPRGLGRRADPAPNATLRAIARRQGTRRPGRARDTVPFSSARKWSGATFADHGTWVLGAPDVLTDDEAVLDRGSRPRGEGKRVVVLARAASLDVARAPERRRRSPSSCSPTVSVRTPRRRSGSSPIRA